MGCDFKTSYQYYLLKLTQLRRLGDKLGSGQFGEVYKGVWQSGKGEIEVAVKTLKKGSDENGRVKFLQEAAIMGQFKHPSIVTMHGVVTEGEPVRSTSTVCFLSIY